MKVLSSRMLRKIRVFLLPKFSIKDLIIDPEKAFPFLMANNNTDYLIKTEEAEYVNGATCFIATIPSGTGLSFVTY